MRTRACFAAVAALALLLPAVAAGEARTYNVDRDHSSVRFTVRHFVSNVPGRFTDFAGKVTYDPQAPEKSTVEMVAQATSIDTDNTRRDDHLRSPDFFDVAKHPTLSFKSVSVERESADSLRVTGDLTIHGVTKRVTIPITVLGTVRTQSGEKAGFETSFTVNRKDFGITWNRALDQGGTVLGDDVKVAIDLEADWAAPQPAATPTPSGR
jgi:polyisoprenoid-binding protein YceI